MGIESKMGPNEAAGEQYQQLYDDENRPCNLQTNNCDSSCSPGLPMGQGLVGKQQND